MAGSKRWWRGVPGVGESGNGGVYGRQGKMRNGGGRSSGGGGGGCQGCCVEVAGGKVWKGDRYTSIKGEYVNRIRLGV